MIHNVAIRDLETPFLFIFLLLQLSFLVFMMHMVF